MQLDPTKSLYCVVHIVFFLQWKSVTDIQYENVLAHRCIHLGHMFYATLTSSPNVKQEQGVNRALQDCLSVPEKLIQK